MIFYPIKFRGIPIWIRDEIPLGLLGWQGIVVRRGSVRVHIIVECQVSQ